VTYKDLKSIEIRGDGEIRCDSALSAEKFKLKAYGENEIRLASLTSGKFKASLYGQNELRIISGSTGQQTYRLFGENRIETRGFKSGTLLPGSMVMEGSAYMRQMKFIYAPR